MPKKNKSKPAPRARSGKLPRRKRTPANSVTKSARTRSKRRGSAKAVTAPAPAAGVRFLRIEKEISMNAAKKLIKPIIPAPSYVLARVFIDDDGRITVEGHTDQRWLFAVGENYLTRDVRQMRSFNNRQTAGAYRHTHRECGNLRVLNVAELVAPVLPTPIATHDAA